MSRSAYFATHCEFQDAAPRTGDLLDVPAAASLELARLLARFEDRIDDEWRAEIIRVGGGLVKWSGEFGRRVEAAHG